MDDAINNVSYETFENCSKCGGERDRPDQRYCRACHAAYQREHRPKHTDLKPAERRKANTRAMSGVYTKRGNIERQACEICDGEKAERHHEDYNDALTVVWLCRPCHTAHHRLEKFREQFRLLGWSRDASFIESNLPGGPGERAEQMARDMGEGR